MLGELSKIVDSTDDEKISRIVNLRFTHKKAPLNVLEATTFKDVRKVLGEMLELGYAEECAVIQTCNRVEIYGVASDRDQPNKLKIAEYWQGKARFDPGKFYDYLEKSVGWDALTHLFRLTSGLESMVVGEDQILGQVRDAYDEARTCCAIGPLLSTIFERAIRIGKEIRAKTLINKGAVSIGSSAVDLLEEEFGNLENKKIIIVGAGETAALVGKALASKRQPVIFVANRTYERGVRLAKILGGQAIRFDKTREFLSDVDVAVVATAAPHTLFTRESLEKVLQNRSERKLIIMDLSQPRNVNESVRELPNVELRSIDDLRGVAQRNLETRLKEVEKAEEIVKREVKRLGLFLKCEDVEPLVSGIYSRAEEIRRRELGRALKIVGRIKVSQRRAIEDLTRSLVEKILHHPVLNLRKAAMNGRHEAITIAQELFNVKSTKKEETA